MIEASMIRYLDPPAEYRHEPKMPVFVFGSDDADRVCRIMYRVPGTIVACQRFLGKTCIIFMDNRLKGTTRQRVLVHEKAHCNGWRHD